MHGEETLQEIHAQKKHITSAQHRNICDRWEKATADHKNTTRHRKGHFLSRQEQEQWRFFFFFFFSAGLYDISVKCKDTVASVTDFPVSPLPTIL